MTDNNQSVESQQLLDVPQLVREAVERTSDYLTPTPLEYSRYLSEQIDGEVWLKLDSMQRTSSFKFRGAINKVLTLTEEELNKGLITASNGNHALAMGEALPYINHSATLYVGGNTAQVRLDLLEAQGVLDVKIVGNDAYDAEVEARRAAAEEGKVYISPYNDATVMGGQGTCGYEISQQLPDVDATFITCGGGGLLAGSAGWLKHHNPETACYGVVSQNSPVMKRCIEAGELFEMETSPTLADTCAGCIDLDSITFDICKRYVDEFISISEEEIADAMRVIFYEHRLVAEGSAALTVAAILKRKDELKGKKVVAVICGKNVDVELFKRIIA